MAADDPQQLWDVRHRDGDHDRLRGLKSRFAKEVSGYLPLASQVLELGCGVGRDAAYFAQQGHDVRACDFSSAVIERNSREIEGVDFFVADISRPLPFPDDVFDLVYAHLSLHYYPELTTRAVFAEIARVVAPAAIFAFACKTLRDGNYGKGERLEANYFRRPNGLPLRFFSESYAEGLLAGRFEILSLVEREQEFNEEHSAVLYCIARRC